MPSEFVYYALGAGAAIGVTLFVQRSRQAGRNLPPGPKPDPVIGNLRQFPQEYWYKTFGKWTKEYGELVYIDVLGIKMIILGSLNIVEELLGKRNLTYSGRPHHVLTMDMMDYAWSVFLVQPGPVHTNTRKLYAQVIGPNVIANHDGIIREHMEDTIDHLTDFKGNPRKFIYNGTGDMVTRLTYGTTIYKEHGQDLNRLNDEVLSQVTWVYMQAWAVEFMPWIRYVIPTWLPGAAFQKIAKKGHQMQNQLRFSIWDTVKKNYEAGELYDGFAWELLKDENTDHDLARDMLAMLYFAGVDTTTTIALIFLMAMVLHPEAQKKVHQELDEVLGFGVQPEPADRTRLPYLEAARKESFRMYPMSPILGVPHSTTAEDTYKGYYIPKDCIVHVDQLGIYRDPSLWEEPDTYKPERFLASLGAESHPLYDITSFTFGFGRRVCPGRHLAERIGYAIASSILAKYEILPVEGESFPTTIHWSDGNIRYPTNFNVHFRPRTRSGI